MIDDMVFESSLVTGESFLNNGNYSRKFINLALLIFVNFKTILLYYKFYLSCFLEIVNILGT